jgi:putative heme-binding domain-containing protein
MFDMGVIGESGVGMTNSCGERTPRAHGVRERGAFFPPLAKGGKGKAAAQSIVLSNPIRAFVLIAACAGLALAARADAPPPPDSPLVKLLKSGRVPEARQGAVVDMIGKRGTVGDLTFVLQQVLSPEGFSAPSKLKALQALAEAAANRNMRPAKDTDKLVVLLQLDSSRSEAGLLKAAVHLAGLWKLEAAAEPLAALAVSPAAEDGLRSEAIESLAAIGGRMGRSRIEALTGPAQAAGTRILALASLARLDVDAAAARAAEILAQADPGRDLRPLLAAFLNLQGGPDVLASKISQHTPPADSAKLALRAIFALGRADPKLIAALSRAAGLAAETKPLTPTELNQLVADVASHGDPARGEAIFRRADLNCLSCHSLAKAGGDVGPDLSSIGQTSPPDYIINSIFSPDQAIKEQYHTLVVQTSDGQMFQGIVTDKDDQRIVLKEATGTPRVVPVASIEDQKAGGSLMPKGLANLMTRPEFVDLVRFLSELGKPGPYAIRSTPTVQRFKVLKPVSQALAASIPDRGVFRDQILNAEPSRWMTSYAKVAGALPLDELSTVAGGNVLYFQGEISVSSAGPVRVQLDSAEGVLFWIDEQPVPPGTPASVTTLAAGHHTVTLRVDAKARSSKEIKVEVTKPAGSPAEFTVVGGH